MRTTLSDWRSRVARAGSGLALVSLLVLPGVSVAAPTAPPATPPAPTQAVPAGPATVEPPSDPTDVQGWLAYRSSRELTALPAQATLLYRLGLEAHKRGDHETAVRLWRGAEEIDPGSLAPRLSLISHFLSNDPPQGLMEFGRLAGVARSSFRLQHYFTSFAVFYGMTALFLATVGVALVLCWRRRHRLQHVYQELLEKKLPAAHARWWAWAAFALPFCLGLGVAVPAVFSLALLWSYLKRNERFAFVTLTAMLVASPMAMNVFRDLSRPVRDNGGPFYSTVGLEREPYSDERLNELSTLSAAHPENGFLAYAEGWMAQRGHHYDQAVAAYERAQNCWSQEARIPNNLGNIEFTRGNGERAEMNYKRALELAPRWAAAHYNLGQLYTARFRYAEASEEIATATALDFDLVRNLQTQSAAESRPALAEDWLEPSSQWEAVFGPASDGDASGFVFVPPLWQPWFESRGVPVSVWTLLMGTLGLVLGFLLHHHLPARTCSNCTATVCRRCATRRRDQVLCGECAALVQSATTPEFGRLILFKRRREAKRREGRLRTIIASVVPGYGILAFDAVITGWIFTLWATSALLLVVVAEPPFPFDPRVVPGAPHPFVGVAVGAFLVCYIASLAVYFTRNNQAREEDAGLESAGSRSAPRLKRAA